MIIIGILCVFLDIIMMLSITFAVIRRWRQIRQFACFGFDEWCGTPKNKPSLRMIVKINDDAPTSCCCPHWPARRRKSSSNDVWNVRQQRMKKKINCFRHGIIIIRRDASTIYGYMLATMEWWSETPYIVYETIHIIRIIYIYIYRIELREHSVCSMLDAL